MDIGHTRGIGHEIPEASKSSMTLQDEGELLFKAGDLHGAYRKFRRAAERVSPIAEVAWLRASIRFDIAKTEEALGKTDQALISYERALDEDPKYFYREHRDRVAGALK
jgi:tetratricopeptide (TPR) repeat protein